MRRVNWVIIGTPIANPFSQTEKLRLIALENEGFSPICVHIVVLKSHFPGVVPQEERKTASINTQIKIINIPRTISDIPVRALGLNRPKIKPKANPIIR